MVRAILRAGLAVKTLLFSSVPNKEDPFCFIRLNIVTRMMAPLSPLSRLSRSPRVLLRLACLCGDRPSCRIKLCRVLRVWWQPRLLRILRKLFITRFSLRLILL